MRETNVFLDLFFGFFLQFLCSILVEWFYKRLRYRGRVARFIGIRETKGKKGRLWGSSSSSSSKQARDEASASLSRARQRQNRKN
jgi:hypothetical protein